MRKLQKGTESGVPPAQLPPAEPSPVAEGPHEEMLLTDSSHY